MKDRLTKIIAEMNIFESTENLCFAPFRSAEDGEEYAVWLVTSEKSDRKYVLKKAKGRELSIYQGYLPDTKGVPRFLGKASYEDEDYLLIEYIEGEPMLKLSRQSIAKALDALIEIQDRFWQTEERPTCGLSFEESLAHRLDRGRYLCDAELEAAYEEFIENFKTLPRTLCHDDLLPFNILISDKGAAIIDWEIGGILPYPTSLARLLAHAEESSDAFFYMTNADKEFAIQYYYDNLIKGKGIAYNDYRKDLDRFFFYEYCEWIMLGNKYADADMDRYQKYLKKAFQILI